MGIDAVGCSAGMLKQSIMHWGFWHIHNWYLDIFNSQAHFCSGLFSNCGNSFIKDLNADTASWLNNQFIVKNRINIGELLISLLRE